jgi:tetratricopeptide (TPR) repeat protein
MINTDAHNMMLPDGKESDSATRINSTPPSIGFKSSIGLFYFALAFRMIYLIQSVDNPLFGVPVVDAYSYVEWAQKMLDGIWLWDSVGNYLPIYPAFLALQQILFGPHPVVNKVIQSIMGAGTAVLMAQAAAHTWNRRVGLISGYLIATYWMLVIFESEKFAESFSIFFLSLTLWLLIRYSNRNWAILAAGFVFALSAGVRANLLLVLPCVLAWLIWLKRSRPSAAISSAFLFACGTVLIIGPIVARNHYLIGTPMLRAQATWSLYSGLAPEFEGLHPPAGILFDKYMDMPAQAGAYSEREIENYWGRKLRGIIKEDPAGVALNFLRRLLIFANAREWSQEFDVAAYRSYSRFLALPWTGFWLIGPLGFLGLFLCRRLTSNQVLMITVTITVILSIVPFKASDRYRLPAAVLLTLFAALAFWYLFEWIKARDKRALGKWLAAGLILCLVCWPDWQDLAARKSARHYFFVGKHYEETGRLDEAVKAYQRSMNEYAWDADSPYRLSLIYTLRGQRQRATKYLNLALKREPAFPQVLNELARHHLRDSELTAAENKLDLSLKFAPANMDALILMAEIQRRQGDIENEIKYLNHAIVRTRAIRPTILLADRYAELENYQAAIRLYERVMRSRQVDKLVRVTAAMLAGITTARYLSPAVDEKIYWHYVINEFDEFRFFSLQAQFLAGNLPAPKFRSEMGDSPAWKASAEYVVGLNDRLKGNSLNAVRAFERCLQVDDDAKSHNRYSPQKWAREDLRRIQNVNSKKQTPVTN